MTRESDSRKPGHVLFIPSWYPRARRSSEGVFFQDQCRALAKSGWRVGVVFPEFVRWRESGVASLAATSRGKALWDMEHGITILRQRILNPPTRRLRALRWVHSAESLAMAYIHREGTPDVLHAQSFLWAGLAGARLARAIGLPLVVTEHSSLVLQGRLRRWEAKRIADAARAPVALVAVSRALGRALTGYVGQRDRIQIIPNAVDTRFFTPSESDGYTRKQTVLCVANLVPVKGVDTLIHAYAELKHRLPQLRLRIAGDGPERRGLEALARERGVAESVVFLGQIERSRVRQEMRDAGVLAMPSRAETFGVVAIEALACGTPVVATTVGGPEDIVRPPFGRLVPPDQPRALADALFDILAMSCQFSKREAWKMVDSEFSAAKLSARLSELYGSLIAHHRPAPAQR